MSYYGYDRVHRLETGDLSDLARGFAAELADPAWLLGRQWQLGEHQGEDASSPVWVVFKRRVVPIAAVDGGPDADARQTPPEGVVEAEPEQWWTVGRRVRLGRSVAAKAIDAGQGERLEYFGEKLEGLPAPYRELDGSGYDGRSLWRARDDIGLDPEWFEPRPPEETDDRWDHAELAYDADFVAGEAKLALRRHDGGPLDWFAVDALTSLADAPEEEVAVLASQLRYPGAPTDRWWEIEEPGLDAGGEAPARSHFATLLMAELLSSHSDDWFTFPIEGTAGTLVAISDVHVVDSFGEQWEISPPSDGWSLFTVRGLDRSTVALWPTVPSPLQGPLEDEVVFGVDEDANVLWAVERRVDGVELPSDAREQPEFGSVDTTERLGYAYRPSPELPTHWHPYVVEQVDGRRRFVQGRLADLSGEEAALAPAPKTDLLADPEADGHPVHQLEPGAVPTQGLRLERRYVLGRRTDGTPLLWRQRRRVPAASPPAFALRFDALEPAPAGPAEEAE